MRQSVDMLRNWIKQSRTIVAVHGRNFPDCDENHVKGRG